MKIKLVAVLICALVGSTQAQEAKSDSSKRAKNVSIKVKIGKGSVDTVKRDTIKPSSKFSVQLTFARLDLGLAKFTDDGSFTLSPGNQLLETHTWQTHNVGFEFFQMGYRFTHNFKIYVGAGMDWTHMRLKKNITIKPDESKLTIVQESIDFKKNRFSSTYLRVPLSFQVRTNDDKQGNKTHLVFGPEIGFLVNGKVKQVSSEQGKKKVKDDFNLNPFRYGAFARLGYDNFGIYVKYYNSDVFADGQGLKALKNINLGIMAGF